MKSKTYLFSTSSHPDTISINSLNITFFHPHIDFSRYDYFLLTSKQSCEVLKYYEAKSLKPAICISEATAQAYEEIGGVVLHVGEGYGDSLEGIVSQYSKKTSWLYLRAKVVASDFAQNLKKNGFSVGEEILYESECSKDIRSLELEENASLIFTSPSSVKCFLQTNEINKNQCVIVIGKTTAKALPKDVKYALSKEKTIQSCINIVNNM